MAKSILLLQLDGKLPNIALMRIAAHHRVLGDEIVLRRSIYPHLGDSFDVVYASAIFTRTRPLLAALTVAHPNAFVGGTGTESMGTIEEIGVVTKRQDYGIYPGFAHSIGFTQRGCRLKCKFCVVPQKEGAVVEEQGVHDIWRGTGYPKHLLLLDNDFFGQPNWRRHIEDIRRGDFKVCFSQGINARMLTDETAEAIASIRYSDDSFTCRRIYTAWDNLKDGERLLAGLDALIRRGVKPDSIMVYMLCGYWPGETHEDREKRRTILRKLGCRPYPMPYVRTPELIAYQRWVIRRIDLNVSWERFTQARFRPERVRSQTQSAQLPLLELA